MLALHPFALTRRLIVQGLYADIVFNTPSPLFEPAAMQNRQQRIDPPQRLDVPLVTNIGLECPLIAESGGEFQQQINRRAIWIACLPIATENLLSYRASDGQSLPSREVYDTVGNLSTHRILESRAIVIVLNPSVTLPIRLLVAKGQQTAQVVAKSPGAQVCLQRSIKTDLLHVLMTKAWRTKSPAAQTSTKSSLIVPAGTQHSSFASASNALSLRLLGSEKIFCQVNRSLNGMIGS